MITDFLDERRDNRYLITGLKDEDVLINIHVLDGDIEASVSDFDKFNSVKKSTEKNKVLYFIFPAKR